MNGISRKKTKKSPMSAVYSAISAFIAVLSFLAQSSKRFFYHSRLELTHEIVPRSQGYPGACEIHYMLRNRGKSGSACPLVELTVVSPKDIYLGHGLFFNENIGNIQSQPRSEFIPLPERIRGNTYTFRLNASISIHPGFPPVMVARFIVCANEETLTTEIDHELKWAVYSPDGEHNSNHVRIPGDILKAIILKQWGKP